MNYETFDKIGNHSIEKEICWKRAIELLKEKPLPFMCVVCNISEGIGEDLVAEKLHELEDQGYLQIKFSGGKDYVGIESQSRDHFNLR